MRAAMRHYLLPYLAYTVPLLYAFIGPVPDWLYIAKNAVALGLLIAFWKRYDWGRPRALPAVVVGAFIAILWMALSRFSEGAAATPLFFAGKALGMLAAAPLVEELFVRDFLNRLVVAKRWETVPIGALTPASFLVSTAFFALSHEQGFWLSAAFTGAILSLLLWRTRTLWTVVIAHFVANLILYAVSIAQNRPELIA